jgi:hypothetical protein
MDQHSMINSTVKRDAKGPWPKVIFWLGLLIFLIVQGILIDIPLLSRDLPPEVDDAVGYVLKTREMIDCPRQDCPALEDLAKQLLIPDTDSPADAERARAATRIFPIYHFTYSLVLAGLNSLGMDLWSAHNIVWAAGPLIFALAFGWLLSVVFGRAPAGVALILLAFKVFPVTGLHLIQPSTLTMALAGCIWARIFSKSGRAPVALVLGAFILVATHPVGRIYAVMAVVLALALTERPWGRKLWWSVGLSLAVIVLAFLLPALLERPRLLSPSLFPEGVNPLAWFFRGALESIVEIAANIIRLREGLFGVLPVFFGAVAFGYLTMPGERKKPLGRVLLVYAIFLLASLFYVSVLPADAFFRIWIPLMVLLFGLAGQAFCSLWEWIRRAETNGGKLAAMTALAVLLGWAVQTGLYGAEQTAGQVRHLIERQPLAFDKGQIDRLLTEAGDGDRVLYTSMIAMPYFLSQGTLPYGAVYWHPSFEGDATAEKWLNRPDLGWAVMYNPLVLHPSFSGRPEINWWISSPDFHYSPLSWPQRDHPPAREGRLRIVDFRRIDVRLDTGASVVRVYAINHGPPAKIIVSGKSVGFGDDSFKTVTADVPSWFSGWLSFNFKGEMFAEFQLDFLPGKAGLEVWGISFDEDGLNWPWSRKARLVLYPRNREAASIESVFDLDQLLPPLLRNRGAMVVNDAGSTVLVRLPE